MKKGAVIALSSGILVAGIGIGLYIFSPKEKIELSIVDNELSWTDKSNTSRLDTFYHIFNDEFFIDKITAQNYTISDSKLIDEVGPEKISNVNVIYTKDKVKLKWNDTKDLGSDNKISVSLYDEDKLISYSNSLNMNYNSGVNEYIVNFNDKEIRVYNNTFDLDTSMLKEGITTITLYAVDNRGNIGEIAALPLYNYNIIISKEKDRLKYHIDDRSQNYILNAFVDGKDLGSINDNDDLNKLIEDDKAPSLVSDIQFVYEDKKVSILWEDSKDVKEHFNVKISGYGETYKNITSSDEMNIERTSGVKGYNYKISKDKKYVVTDKDTFVEGTSMEFKGNYGEYYLHIASVDNNDNISKTKSFKFDIRDLTLVKENENVEEIKQLEKDKSNQGAGNTGKPDIVKPVTPIELTKSELLDYIIVPNGSISSDNMDKAYNLAGRLPKWFIEKMKSVGLSVILTSGEAEDIYKSVSNLDITDISGIFVWGGNDLYIISEVAYLDSTLLHELGHAFDYLYGEISFLSDTSEFNSIYNDEKNIFFLDDEYTKASSKEYFAEVFAMYFNNASSLKSKSPKTYEYISKAINRKI